MTKMSDTDSKILELEREIRSKKVKPILAQRVGVLSVLESNTGGSEFLKKISISDAANLDSSGIKITGVEFDYDFNCGEWAK